MPAKKPDDAAPEVVAEDAAPATKIYRVRPGFAVHFTDGRDAVEGPAEVELTEAEARAHAVQIEDPAAQDEAPAE